MPELTTILSNLQLLESTSFQAALEQVKEKMEAINAELLKCFGNGTTVDSRVKGGSGRAAVRHHA
jgi:hypothetical protein